jgi:4-amino-4-deoxy-L-arabinose transferase-like glycosyltransferase
MKCGLKFIKDNIILIFILTFGLLLRTYNLGHESFWFDETISSIAAISLSENGAPIFPSGFFYSRAILNTFLIAVSFSFLGVNEFAGRFPSVIFGTLTILLVYHMGSKWGNKRVGLLAAILVAFSVWEIAWSRQARMYQQLQFFYVLSLYLFYEYVNHRNKKHLYLLIASLAATILSHVFGYVLIGVFLLFLAASFLKEKHYNVLDKKNMLYVALAFIFLFGLAYNRGVISNVIQTQVNYYDEYIYFLKENLGFALFFAVPGATVLLNRDWSKGLLLTISVIIPFYVIFFHVLLFAVRYLYFVIPVVLVLVAYFLDFVIDYVSEAISKKWGHFISDDNIQYSRSKIGPIVCSITMVLLIVLMSLSPAFTFIPKEAYDLGPNAPRSDFRKAYSYVDSNMQPGDVVVSAWTAPAQFYLGKNDYWLAFNVMGTGMEPFTVENATRDKYSNSIVIKDTKMLENVTCEHERGWIVTDTVAWYKISPQSRDFIESNTTKQLQDSTIRVYMWDYTNASACSTL